MIMYLCDDWYNLENTDANTMVSKYRCIHDPKFIPRIGERVDLGNRPCSVVKDVVYNYELNVVVVTF